MVDWSGCADVESVPGKVSGDFLVKGTRIPADAVLANARAGLSAEEIVETVFDGLSLECARRIIAFGASDRLVTG